MKTLAALGLTALAFLTGAAIAQEAEKPSGPPFQRVATMSQLMVDIIYPTSDAIFYIERQPPSTPKEWNDFKSQALMLAEAGNLLMMEGRARDQGDWMKYSKMMLDAGAAAYKAAQAKDVNAIIALNEPLYEACVMCHQQYRPGYGRRPLKGNTK